MVFVLRCSLECVIKLFSAVKKRRNWHRHDYSEADDNINKVSDNSGNWKLISVVGFGFLNSQ